MLKTVITCLLIPFIGTAAGAMLYVVVEELIPGITDLLPLKFATIF